MRALTRLLLAAGLFVVPAPPLSAQTAADPSGHWEGTIRAPQMDLTIEIDLAKNSKGQLAGTFGQPAQSVKGLPLSVVAVDGRSVRFVIKAGPDTSTFEGVLSADGKSMAGQISQAAGSLPLTLTRTGEARIASVARSSAVSNELEGTWHGALDFEGRQMRLILTMTNHSDGTATGTIVSPDGSGVEIAVAMTQKGSNVTVDVTSVGASFVGAVDAAGTQLVGTWSQGPSVLPLTFKRTAR
jgi:hypothetical protein